MVKARVAQNESKKRRWPKSRAQPPSSGDCD